MRIGIVTVGKRGDVQPFVALGLRLKAAGHEVRIATNDTCALFIHDAGLDLIPISGNPTVDIAWSGREIKGSINPAQLRPVRTALLSLSNVARQRRLGVFKYEECMCRHLEDTYNACRGCDAVVFSLPGFFGGYAAAEKLGVPYFPAYTDPIHPTRAFPHPLVSGLRLGAAANQLTYHLVRRVFWKLHGAVANRARREVLGLPPVAANGPYGELERWRAPVLYAFSSAVLPKPTDWEEHVHLTGYWWLDRPATWRPQSRLLDFLNSGAAPLYIGFGSVQVKPGGWDKQNAAPELMNRVIQTLVRTKMRAVLLGGAEFDGAKLPDSIFVTGPVPFDWLYPRMAAVVHHGGAGTVAAAFRAGVASIVVPFTAFQPFWARRVYELGTGPQPIHPQHVTVDRLAEAIRAVTTDRACAGGRRPSRRKYRPRMASQTQWKS